MRNRDRRIQGEKRRGVYREEDGENGETKERERVDTNLERMERRKRWALREREREREREGGGGESERERGGS